MPRPERSLASRSTLTLLLLVLSLAGPAAAGNAGDLAKGVQPLKQVELVTLPPVDNAALLAEDLAQGRMPGVPLRYAQELAVFHTPSTSGTWEILPDGSLLWRLRLRSPGAVSLSVALTRYAMPAGGTLVFYAAAAAKPVTSLVHGPYTERHNQPHGQLWTPIVPGDEAVVEVRLPAGRLAELELELTEVHHGYRAFGSTAAGDKSGSCNVDVVCPEGDPWSDQIRSVAAIGIGGSRFCTGFMVNNTAQDLRPYFMTADHCDVGTQFPAPSVVFYWNYENPTCRPVGSAESGTPFFGNLDQTQTGATVLDRSAVSDYTLLELNQSPDPSYDVFWAGWDARPIDPPMSFTVHHPRGHAKRISFENDPTTTTSYLQDIAPGDGTHIRVEDWDLGTTEPGSSGSPLFNQVGRVVGQLHGGFAACDNDLPDWYGRFSRSWELGLSQWLDPGATGVMVLDGTDTMAALPAAPSNLAATALSANQIRLDWVDNAVDEDEFRIEVREMAAAARDPIPDSLRLSPAASRRLPDAGAKGLKPGELIWQPDKACVLMNMTCNSTVQGDLTGDDCTIFDGTFIDFWEFQGTAGQTVTIDMTSSDFDTYLFLIDPFLDTADVDDDGGGGTNSRIVYTLDSSGAWTIGANAFLFGETGSYTLTLGCSGGGPSAPAAPSNLTATALSTSEIRLDWQDNSVDEDEFLVEMMAPGGAFVEILTLPANTTSVDVTGLERDTPYAFRVRARNAVGDSPYSNQATATTLSGFVDVGSAPADATSFTVGGLAAGTTYELRVKARSAAGDSAYSNIATATTLPAGPGCTDDLTNGVVCLFRDAASGDFRFRFFMTWTNTHGVTQPVFFDKYTDRTALAFFFAGMQDVALNVKAVEGCAFDNHWWIWYGGASGGGARWDLMVEDTFTGRTASYSKNFGEPTVGTRDNTNFPCF